MSTIIRVKRSLLEDPIEDKIVLNYKRQKTSESSTVFKFAKTIEKVCANFEINKKLQLMLQF